MKSIDTRRDTFSYPNFRPGYPMSCNPKLVEENEFYKSRDVHADETIIFDDSLRVNYQTTKSSKVRVAIPVGEPDFKGFSIVKILDDWRAKPTKYSTKELRSKLKEYTPYKLSPHGNVCGFTLPLNCKRVQDGNYMACFYIPPRQSGIYVLTIAKGGNEFIHRIICLQRDIPYGESDKTFVKDRIAMPQWAQWFAA